MKKNNVDWLVGQEEVVVCPLPPYSDIVVRFLDELSGILRQKATGGRYADVISLAFWCRKGNILKWKECCSNLENSMGRGLIFHITPSNVPVNFAFSYFFGLLAGNANIVRVPSKEYPQIEIICESIRTLLDKPEYTLLKEGTAFVRYGHDREITDALSAKADGRIIWGGDGAIQSIRRSPAKSKSVEIVFADRYSLGLLESKAVLEASEEECSRLARQFYNDTYLMDQNACSAPHLILWMGERREEAKEKFWNAVHAEAGKYELEPIKAVDKYTDLCVAGMREDSGICKISRWGNLLYTIDLESLPEDICSLRGRFGMFYQCGLEDINHLAHCINERVQTLLYYGVDKQQLLDFVLKNHLRGVDRIVPFGNSLDMNVYWDGYDIIGQLSRRIIVE